MRTVSNPWGAGVTERFWSMAGRKASGCWPWLGAVTSNGYGYLRIGRDGVRFSAHRLAVLLRGVPIPKGMEIDHLCRNRRCVRPSHLEVVSHRENDIRGKGPSMETHKTGTCRRGHSGSWLYRKNATGNGVKQCRECNQIRNRNRARIALLVMFFAAGLFAQTLPPQCTDPGWYQRTCDGNWNFAIEGNKEGDIFYGCAAHTYIIFGHNGAQYAILDQCYPEQHCTGTTGTYKRPDDPVAQARWDCFYTTSCDLGGGVLTPQERRERFGYYNSSFQIPTGTQHYNLLRLVDVQPESRRIQLAALYGCTNFPSPTVPVPPTKTKTPIGGVPTRTRTAAPTPDPCAVIPGGCSPTPNITRTRTWTNTPVNTPTATRAVPSPSATSVPPSSSTPTAVPTLPAITSTAVPTCAPTCPPLVTVVRPTMTPATGGGGGCRSGSSASGSLAAGLFVAAMILMVRGRS